MLLNVPGMSWLLLEHSVDKCGYLGEAHGDTSAFVNLIPVVIDGSSTIGLFERLGKLGWTSLKACA